MDVSIFGYKINLEVLILFGVLYLILVGHLFCGCCNRGIMEGFTDASGTTIDASNIDISGHIQNLKTAVQNKLSTTPAANTNLATQSTAGGSTTAATTSGTSTESFTGMASLSQAAPYSLTSDTPVNTDSWNAPSLVVTPGQPLSSGVKEILNRPKQQLPLKDGEMLFFKNMEFKPECCPAEYSNSSGCSCFSPEDYNYLTTRGGNNVPYSEY